MFKLALYRIMVKRDNRFYVQKRKWWLLGWKTQPGVGFAISDFAANEIVQQIRNEEKRLNTRVVAE